MRTFFFTSLLLASSSLALPQYQNGDGDDDTSDPLGDLGGFVGSIGGGIGELGSQVGDALGGLTSSLGDAAGQITGSLIDPLGLGNLLNPARFGQAKRRANAVREAFRFSWNGYSKFAFPNDELHPVDNTWGNSRNGWGASAVDALSTAIIMKEANIVNQILDYIPKIDFTKSKDNAPVSVFETTIRYLGGMISAYDLLHSGSFSRLANNQDNVAALLRQSVTLADRLEFAYHLSDKTNNCSIPYNDLLFDTNSAVVRSANPTNNIAQVGTLILEWTRLSDLTRNPKYFTLASNAEAALLNPQPADGRPQTDAEPFPGLVGQEIYVNGPNACKFATNTGGWGGGDDSFYEYLIKAFVYDTRRFSFYKDRWVAAAESAMKYLASKPTPLPGQPAKDLTFLAVFNGKQVETGKYSQHLTCFDGGNFILGGQVLKRRDITNFGLKLVDSCYATYKATATGIGPEAFSWDSTRVPADQVDFYNRNGFWITSGAFILRPEVLESIYYAYRLTGDSKYQDWAWDAFVKINGTVRTGSGFAGVDNVNAPGGGNKINDQESFFFAELLKYAYMIHIDDQPWQVFGSYGKRNQFVFNTEAHPIRVAGNPV